MACGVPGLGIRSKPQLGPNPHWGNAGSSPHCAGLGIEPACQYYQDSTNDPTAPQWEFLGFEIMSDFDLTSSLLESI